MDKVTVEGNLVRVVSPEGKECSLPLADLLGHLAPPRMDCCDVVLPDGVKLLRTEGPVMIWVHQTSPRVFGFKWIAGDSPAAFGPGTRYRKVKIALPYLIVIAVFVRDDSGRIQLSGSNECFFRNESIACLDGADAQLHFPALLNCSKFSPPEGKPLAWICTQHLDHASFAGECDPNQRLRAAFKSLMSCLLVDGFNYSSEHHEETSWFSASRALDPRISSIEEWEKATAENEKFVLEVPWLPTGMSIRQVTDRIFKNLRAASKLPRSAADVARIVCNHSTPPRRAAAGKA